MAVDTRYDIPAIPQEGITQQILAGIQLANEQHAQRQAQALQQQQLGLQQAAQPSEIAQREAEARRFDSQTQLEKMNMDLRRELIGTLTGTTPGAVSPAQVAPPSPSPAPVAGASPAPVVGGSAPANGGAAAIGPGAAPATQPGTTPSSQVSALYRAAGITPQNQAPNAQPAPAPAKSGGLIGQTVDSLLADPSLTSTERRAISLAGSQSILKTYLDPQTALDGVVSTYNDILKSKGETARTIKTEVVPDSQSSTGYSTVATSADGTEAYRHAAPPPLPKNLEEASANLGSASFNYQRDPTPGNKSALDLASVQHDSMYKDRIAEASQQARATALAQGKDYEAMIRTGKNPITGETLSLNNAPPSALINPATGQVIPQDMISLYKPTQSERQTADTARQVLAISADLKDEIAKNPALIGPLAGRSEQALQKIGVSAQDSSKLIDDLTFMQSAATKMHTGRFSSEILNKMSGIIKPGMSQQEFLGSLDSVNDVATRYANEDKLTTVYEYQQRQQFENQGAANPFVPGQFSAGNPFAPKK